MPNKPKSSFLSFDNLRREVKEDIGSDKEDELIDEIRGLIGDDDNDAKEFKRTVADEEVELSDYETMIEKDLDNWI